jgi:hypothetical protein
MQKGLWEVDRNHLSILGRRCKSVFAGITVVMVALLQRMQYFLANYSDGSIFWYYSSHATCCYHKTSNENENVYAIAAVILEDDNRICFYHGILTWRCWRTHSPAKRLNLATYNHISIYLVQILVWRQKHHTQKSALLVTKSNNPDFFDMIGEGIRDFLDSIRTSFQ